MAAQGARIVDLVRLVMRYKSAYYAGRPEVSDVAYDRLEEELRVLDPGHPALEFVGTAGARDVRGEPSLPRIAHRTPMLSLEKTYSTEDLRRWTEKHPVMGTIKVDGNSLSLVYSRGKLVQAKTRGDGRLGEDVLGKARWVGSIPRELPRGIVGTDDEIEVRGELFCTETNFLQLADAMVALGLERPTSPRNIVAGLLGRKVHFDLARWFDFFAFDLLGANDLATETETFRVLGGLGFALPHHRLLKTWPEIEGFLEEVRSMMDVGEIGLDGAVFTYEARSLHRELGATAHHPRYKMSFKWAGETAESVIQKITWATSRLGFVTPVAVIEPVRLSGAQITNITLHNAAHVRAYNLKVGDRIELVRSGEVIPKFLRVVTGAAGVFVWPKQCPECGTELVLQEVKLQCPNSGSCPAQISGGILNWIRCVGIEDLSEKRLDALMAAGFVRSIPDLYRVTPEQLMKLPAVREKMAAKLVANIEATRELDLPVFLNGLGIEGAGQTSWEAITATAASLAAVRRLSEADIVAIDGFAEKSADQIVTGLKAKSKLIDDLLAVGLRVRAVDPARNVAAKDGPLAGKQIVITGILSRPRAEVEAGIKASGGSVGSAVSKNTFAVVTDDPSSGSSKMKKARDLGVQVWSEDDLNKMMS